MYLCTYVPLTYPYFIQGGKGDTFHNGVRVEEGKEEKVAIFDRLAVGDQLMMFHWPDHEVSMCVYVFVCMSLCVNVCMC
jgi:hypothetical protein